jgi:predicted double-glycine peptidase
MRLTGERDMTTSRLLARTRQVTEYSCGACALQAVMSYWGKNVDERELMKVLKTTSEEGTYPDTSYAAHKRSVSKQKPAIICHSRRSSGLPPTALR